MGTVTADNIAQGLTALREAICAELSLLRGQQGPARLSLDAFSEDALADILTRRLYHYHGVRKQHTGKLPPAG